MRFLLLGPVAVQDERGEGIRVGGPRVRAVLAALLLADGRCAAPERLFEDVWGAELPQDPGRALQIAVSRLRRGLEDPDRVAWDGVRYRLSATDDEVDLDRFRREFEEGRHLLDVGDPGAARECLRRALARWRGHPLEGIGDAPIVRTASPGLEELHLQALRTRIEADIAAGEHAEVLPELRSLVAQRPLDESLHGLLMLALYRSGRQADALTAFNDARETLIRELGAEPQPELRVLHERLLAQDPGLDAPPATTPVQPVSPRTTPNLGTPVTSFVGRDDDLARVHALLDEHRLVTITGTGGTGKTRLATELARQRSSAHPSGRWLVDLAPVASPRRVAPAVARALGLGTPDEDGAWDVVEGALSDQGSALIVLDNAEHLLEEVAEAVRSLLSKCPDLTLLVTSRLPLGIPDEHLWSLRGLAVPPPGGGMPASPRIADVPAVRLFLERARASAPGFSPGLEELGSIARVCRRVSGIPLAIELAAAWVRVLPCAEIASQLSPSGPVLAAATTSTRQRDRSLLAALDWSYERLAPADRALLRRLAVFRGDVSLEAARHVAAAHGDDGDVVGSIGRLVTHSLLEAVPGAGGGSRFRLLEPVREYALAHLEAEQEVDAAGRAHGSWCRELWGGVHRTLRRGAGELPEVVLDELLDEELHSALERALRTGWTDLALQLVGVAYVYWWTYGRMVEGLSWARRAVEVAPPGPSRDRVVALAAAAFLEAHVILDSADRGCWASVRDTADAARREARRLAPADRPAEVADAALTLSLSLLHTDGDVQRAARLADEGRSIAECHGDAWATGYARTVVAATAWFAGDLDTAAAAYEAIVADAGDARSTPAIAARFNLGDLALQRERFPEAREHFEAVLDLKARTHTDPFGRRHSNVVELTRLARACAGAGDHEAARGYAERALTAAAALDDPDVLRRCREAARDALRPGPDG